MSKWIGSFLLLLCITNSSSLSLASPKKMDDKFFGELQSASIEILPKGHLNTYPFFSLSPYNIMGLRWTPDWNEDLIPTACSLKNIKKATISQNIPQLWQNCEPLIRLNPQNQVHDTMSMLSYDFDPLHHPLSREVIFHLPNAVKVRGLLFLRSSEPHPLVIVRAGIFSSFNSMIAERFIFSQLFERGNFHLLIIPSTTGRQFIEDNDHFVFGGFEEGLHTLWIARELKKSKQPLSPLIQEIHTVGISMGANGVLAANLLNAIQKQGWIERSVYFCPLMDFNSTLTQLKEKTLKTLLTSLWTGIRLEPLRKKYSISMFEFFDYVKLVARLTQNYKSPLIGWDDELLPPAAKNISSFTEFNDLKTWLSYKNLTNPSLLFYSLVDPVVPPATNILSVQDQLPTNIHVLPMNKGMHCTVPANYNEAFMATLVNDFLNTKNTNENTNKNSNNKEPKAIWQKSFSYENSDIKNLKIIDLTITAEAKLSAKIKNVSPFSRWQTEIEIPSSAIDMYFDLQIWNRHLKKSLLKWLEAHSQFRYEDNKLKEQILLQINLDRD